MRKSIVKFVKLSICLTLSLYILCSCTTIHGEATVTPGKIAPKAKTLLYIKSDIDQTFGNGTARNLQTIAYYHGIDTMVIDSTNEIPYYNEEIHAGSCFSIAPHYAITNAHVLNYGYYDQLSIIIAGISYNASIKYLDEENDIALLYVPDFTFPFSFDLQKQDEYNLAEDIYVLGFPITNILNQDPRVTTGIINAKSGFDGNSEEIQISAQIQPGSSGGPIIRKGNLKNVIGIASSTLSDIATLADSGTVMQNVNFGIKSKVPYTLIPSINEIDAEINNYPEDLDEASQAIALVYTTYKPEPPYQKRLLVVPSTDTTETLNITRYGSWYDYFTVLSIKFFDVETANIDSSVVNSFETDNLPLVVAWGLDDYFVSIYGDTSFFDEENDSN